MPSGVATAIRLAGSLLCAALLLGLGAASVQAAAPTHPFLPAISHEGTLGYSCGAATDANGDLYVAEYSAHEVNVFDPSGAFITQFETSGNSEGPCGLAVDSSGDVYVAGYETDVVKYTPGGAGYPPTASTTYSSAGTVVASGAKGVAIDPANDDLYVAFSNHVSSYEPNGTPISTTIGQGLVSGAAFTDVDVYGPNGDVYVLDQAHNKAYVLNPAGSAILTEITAADSAQGAFTGMQYPNLAVDQSNGHVFVSDLPGHQVVDEFDAAGHFVADISHTPALEEGFPSGIAVDNSGSASQGTVYVTSGSEFNPGSVYAFGALVYGHQLKVAKNGSGGGTVIGGSVAKPDVIQCGGTCESSFESGAEVTLVATPDSHSSFAGWTGCDSEPGPGECVIVVGADREISASFVTRHLTVVKKGPGTATITSSPASINCGSVCSESFPDGSEITLSAALDAGSRIKSWSGCDELLGVPGAQQCKLTLHSDVQVNATFSAKPAIESTTVHATDTSARFEARVNPNREETSYQFEYLSEDAYQANGESFSGPEEALLAPATSGSIAAGTAGVRVSADVTSLASHVAYRFRMVASNVAGTSESSTGSFTTLVGPPSFGPCPNDAYRSGAGANLPDCRAYEQASPVNKNFGDIYGDKIQTRAAADGSRVVFAGSSPLPGAEGAQTFDPLYMASRGAGGWSTQGILPPEREGQFAAVLGWTPDLSHVYSWARIAVDPQETTLLDRSSVGAPLKTIVPHNAGFNEPSIPAESADGSVVLFEYGEGLPLTPEAPAFKSNLYAWDRETGVYRLVGIFNDGTAPPGGSFAGSYDWMNPTNGGISLVRGGHRANYLTVDQHVISTDGSRVYFTAGKTGQLYLRLNPTEAQSDVVTNGNGEEECTQPELACTIRVSTSEKTNGAAAGGADAAGTHPAAFLGASVDGSKAIFTSSEMLTNDANTGPEQPPAQIGRAKIGATEAEEERPGFLPKHALGLATSPDGNYLYWVDPSLGTIGRAELNGSGDATHVDDEYIVPGETSFETHPIAEPGVLHSAPSVIRYLAVDDEYVYWTNRGPLGGENFNGTVLRENILAEAGTIGRAKIGASNGELVDPEFITGVTNPFGIAANDSHIYWVTKATFAFKSGIGRAGLGGDGDHVEPYWEELESVNQVPAAITLSSTFIYIGGLEQESSNFGQLWRIPLGGGTVEGFGVERGEVNGIALDGSFVYWTSRGSDLGKGTIGRIPLSDFKPRGCFDHPVDCDQQFIAPAGTLGGLAFDSEAQIYWSANGEGGANPGNDLYLYDSEKPSGERLTDLTVDPAENGAEVMGVLGTSADGTYIYFAANAVMDEGASPGNCKTGQLNNGTCDVYLYHEGQTSFVAHIGDDLDWSGGYYSGNNVPQAASTARVSPDGHTLLFSSSEQLTGYENHGTAELYRYRVGDPGTILCVSCSPTGERPSRSPAMSSISLPGFSSRSFSPPLTRNLSVDGNRVFFETTESLVAEDVNEELVVGGPGGDEPCPDDPNGGRVCQDVYEWEAKGTGSCESEAQNGGCLYLISSGKSAGAAYFLDASTSGDDVFFFTREPLAPSDTDPFVDVYDARVNGGLASQNEPPPPPPCEGEACKRGASAPPSSSSPATPFFSGPANPKPHHKKAKGRKRKHRHRHGRHQHKRHANSNGRAHR